MRLFSPLETKLLNKLQHTEIYLLSIFFTFSPFMHHLKLKRNTQFATRKRVLSHHHAMHHFHAISPMFLLFHESHPEEMANHAITPCTTFTLSRQLLCCFTNHALKKGPITPSRQSLGVPPSLSKFQFTCNLSLMFTFFRNMQPMEELGI